MQALSNFVGCCCVILRASKWPHMALHILNKLGLLFQGVGPLEYQRILDQTLQSDPNSGSLYSPYNSQVTALFPIYPLDLLTVRLWGPWE